MTMLIKPILYSCLLACAAGLALTLTMNMYVLSPVFAVLAFWALRELYWHAEGEDQRKN